MINTMIIRVIGAFLSIFAFSIHLETPRNHVVKAGLIGAIGGFVYLISKEMQCGEILSTFISALTIAFVSHIFARIFQTPVTLFLVAGILPTVPGAGMYRIVYYVIMKDEAMASFYMIQTLQIAGVIALAIFLMDSIFRASQRGNWKELVLKYVHKADLK